MKVMLGRAKRQPVTVGIVSGEKAQIVVGLNAGDLVIPSSNALIKDGQRVGARASHDRQASRSMRSRKP
jgi:hypothetical protein